MKLTKQHQISFIKQLGIEDNIQTRMDCPFCLNTNTFAINTEDGNMNWKCFHANCSIGGSTKRNLSPQDVEKFLELSSKSKGSDKPVENSWTVPKHFTNIQSSPKCFQYVVKDRDKPVSAVGRSLNPMVMPKWFNYNKNNVPFTCGHSDTAVIVEDCASACAVSFLYTGVALLGTTLKEEYAYYISQRFKKVIVALDRDATNKAFDLSKGLRYLIDTEVKVLEEDLKYLDSTKIKELFNVT